MVNPTRITVAFDKQTADLLEKISTTNHLSQSEIMRRALKFYSENETLEDPAIWKKMKVYASMLLNGEHIILDVDHWLMFLTLISTATPAEQQKFWAQHKEVARAHWEQLKETVHTAEDLLSRLETCNFYRLTKNGPNDFTLVLVSQISKDFVKIFLAEYFEAMDVEAEIKEDMTKLRIRIKPAPNGHNRHGL